MAEEEWSAAVDVIAEVDAGVLQSLISELSKEANHKKALWTTRGHKAATLENPDEWQSEACIANIAARLSGPSVNSAVYDHTQGKHIHVSGSVSATSVNVYDHDRGAHVTGSPANLYDYGRGAHISLNLNGTRFSGYDHGSGNHYSGNINGHSVTIYDHESGQHHHFKV